MSTAIDNYLLFSLVVGFYWRIVPKGSHKLKPFLWLVQICHIPFFLLLFDRKRGCRRLNLTPILRKKKKAAKTILNMGIHLPNEEITFRSSPTWLNRCATSKNHCRCFDRPVDPRTDLGTWNAVENQKQIPESTSTLINFLKFWILLYINNNRSTALSVVFPTERQLSLISWTIVPFLINNAYKSRHEHYFRLQRSDVLRRVV